MTPLSRAAATSDAKFSMNQAGRRNGHRQVAQRLLQQRSLGEQVRLLRLRSHGRQADDFSGARCFERRLDGGDDAAGLWESRRRIEFGRHDEDAGGVLEGTGEGGSIFHFREGDLAALLCPGAAFFDVAHDRTNRLAGRQQRARERAADFAGNSRNRVHV
jgi:hypothetical protein